MGDFARSLLKKSCFEVTIWGILAFSVLKTGCFQELDLVEGDCRWTDGSFWARVRLYLAGRFCWAQDSLWAMSASLRGRISEVLEKAIGYLSDSRSVYYGQMA